MNECVIEFTIKPFKEGSPGRHVISGIESMEGLGLDVSMGPFSSTVTGDVENISKAIGPMITAAAKDGAHHVLIEVVIGQR